MTVRETEVVQTTRPATVRIGGASGYWGDSDIALPQFLREGDLDYIVFDYLAEITMSIMARARAKDPALGYASDFVSRTLQTMLVPVGSTSHPSSVPCGDSRHRNSEIDMCASRSAVAAGTGIGCTCTGYSVVGTYPARSTSLISWPGVNW